jgi:hypothetical protein
MSRELFMLLFVVGSGSLAVWVALRVPQIAPHTLRAAGVHICAALLLGCVLSPALRLVPGQPGTTSVLVALFGIALPALTYMLLAGLWLLLVFAGDPFASRR